MHTPTAKEIRTVERFERHMFRQNATPAVVQAWGDARGWLYVAKSRGEVRMSFRARRDNSRKAFC
jgi:hypothetical protein